jgi:hypothetical protein
MPSNIASLGKHGFPGKDFLDEETAAAYGNVIETFSGELSSLMDELDVKITAITNETSKGLLTPAGHLNRLETLGNVIMGRVEEIGAAYRKRLDADLTRALRDVKHELRYLAGDRAQQELRLREIREQLLVMPVTDLNQVYQNAAREADEELLLAVHVAPRILREKLVRDEDGFKEAVQILMERKFPEEYSRAHIIREVRGHVQFAVGHARSIVSNKTGAALPVQQVGSAPEGVPTLQT